MDRDFECSKEKFYVFTMCEIPPQTKEKWLRLYDADAIEFYGSAEKAFESELASGDMTELRQRIFIEGYSQYSFSNASDAYTFLEGERYDRCLSYSFIEEYSSRMYVEYERA